MRNLDKLRELTQDLPVPISKPDRKATSMDNWILDSIQDQIADVHEYDISSRGQKCKV